MNPRRAISKKINVRFQRLQLIITEVADFLNNTDMDL